MELYLIGAVIFMVSLIPRLTIAERLLLVMLWPVYAVEIAIYLTKGDKDG